MKTPVFGILTLCFQGDSARPQMADEECKLVNYLVIVHLVIERLQKRALLILGVVLRKEIR